MDRRKKYHKQYHSGPPYGSAGTGGGGYPPMSYRTYPSQTQGYNPYQGNDYSSSPCGEPQYPIGSNSYPPGYQPHMDPQYSGLTTSTADAGHYAQSYPGPFGHVPCSSLEPTDVETMNRAMGSLNINNAGHYGHYDSRMYNDSVTCHDNTHDSRAYGASRLEHLSSGSHQNDISRRNTGGALNPQYKIQKNPEKYFDVGTVFSILWNEPAGNNGTLISQTHITEGMHGQKIYNSIRRMVVVRQGSHCAWCLPILTYGGRGLAKSGIVPEEHAVVYMRGCEPTMLNNERPTEKKPLEVKPATEDQKLDKMSRLNFGKIYTVEHNIRVMPVGVLSSASRSKLIVYAKKSFELMEPKAPSRSNTSDYSFPGSL